MTARSSLNAEETEEIRILRAEYFDASKRAAEAIQTGEHPFDGTALSIVINEDARAGKAMRRIKEIYGIATGEGERAPLNEPTPIKMPNPFGETQREVPKVGSRDAPGG
jgi:hypothetical protein